MRLPPTIDYVKVRAGSPDSSIALEHARTENREREKEREELTRWRNAALEALEQTIDIVHGD